MTPTAPTAMQAGTCEKVLEGGECGLRGQHSRRAVCGQGRGVGHGAVPGQGGSVGILEAPRGRRGHGSCRSQSHFLCSDAHLVNMSLSSGLATAVYEVCIALPLLS